MNCKNSIFSRLAALPGRIGCYYKDLTTGETCGFCAQEAFLAASVIKLPIYAVVMKLSAEGKLDLSETLLCREEDKMPPCGALCFFTGELSADIRTLCGLMITLSDNTATNLLIRRLGIDCLNEQFREMGLKSTRLERLLFDSAASARGLENRFVPEELGLLLERIYRHEFVSETVSTEMETLLLQQQINHKIPGYLPGDIPVAHKTGEDEGITNDVAIVYGPKPYILCFASNETDVPRAEIALREMALELL